MTEQVEAEVVKEETALAPPDSTTLIALQRAEIDQMITTAKAYPRSIEKFKADMLSMATLDEETAESMYYTVPRAGEIIQGESVRLMEIAGSCWGNVRYGARVVEIGDEFITARGTCFDLERNTGVEIDVKRRIVNKYGKRYGTDMIQTTGLAACSIALRNAIGKIVPKAYIKPVLKKAMAVAAGDAKTLEVKRTAALEFFKTKYNIKAAQVFELLDVKGKADIGVDHIVQLLGIKTALSDGEAHIHDVFPPEEDKPAKGAVSTDSLKGAAVKTESKAPEQKEPAKKKAAKKKGGSRAGEAGDIFE